VRKTARERITVELPTRRRWPKTTLPDGRKRDDLRVITRLYGGGARLTKGQRARRGSDLAAAPARTRGIMHAQPRVAAARIRSYLRAGQLP
jgi:hypothetical protein